MGLAAAGLRLLAAGLPAEPLVEDAKRNAIAAAVEAFRRPRAQLALGIVAAAQASALIDVSDGLVQDAGHLATASGVRLVLELDAILAAGGASLAVAAAAAGADPRALALAGGEDYALLATAPVCPPGFLAIGRVEAGAGVEVRERGEVVEALAGFDHFMGAR